MAWGNFLTLPCPLKRWDNDLKNYMLGFLPSVGLIIGLIWAGVSLLLAVLPIPFLVTAFLLTMVPFVLSGFLHLDGFMDCCDAILSRRPLEERQRILKDSHTGAFAVISVVFLLMGFHAFFSSALSISIDFVDLCLIPAVSRSASGLNVLLRRPMGTSQYAKGEGASDSKQKKKASAIILVQLILFSAAGVTAAVHAGSDRCHLPGCSACCSSRVPSAWRHERRHCRIRYRMGRAAGRAGTGRDIKRRLQL